MDAFAWLGNLMEWFGSLIPKIKIVRKTHGGVRFKCGHRVTEMKPGLHVYWPIVTEIDVVPVARQTHNMVTQCVITKDGKQLVVGGVVVYSIIDVVKALSKNWDFNDTINDVSLTAFFAAIIRRSMDELISEINKGTFEKDLTLEVRSNLRRYGVYVHRAAMTDFSTCQTINSVGNVAPMIR